LVTIWVTIPVLGRKKFVRSSEGKSIGAGDRSLRSLSRLVNQIKLPISSAKPIAKIELLNQSVRRLNPGVKCPLRQVGSKIFDFE